LVLNAEYLIPISAESGFKFAVFFDAGRGFDEDESIQFFNLRYTAGTGIRWMSPIGPLRFEWGYNLNRQSGEPSSLFEFAIGPSF
jgi:outer membrane protein insertion porin family